MLLKKTIVRLGSIFLSTQLAHVLKTLPYATGREISSYSVDPSSNDPRLFHQITNKRNQPQWFYLNTIILEGAKLGKHLQNFHVESVHPPYVCVKDQVVYVLPINSMLLDWFRHDYTIQYAVHIWIVWIWLNQKWSPIKLHCSIVALQIDM